MFRAVAFADRKICLALPDTSEGLQFGQPVWRAGKKVFARAYCYDEERRVAFWVGVHAQLLMTDDPRYRSRPTWDTTVGLRSMSPGSSTSVSLRPLALGSYRHFALKKMLAKLPTA